MTDYKALAAEFEFFMSEVEGKVQDGEMSLFCRVQNAVVDAAFLQKQIELLKAKTLGEIIDELDYEKKHF